MPAIDDQIDLGPEVPDFSPAAEPPYVPPPPGPVGPQLLRPPPQVNISPDMTQRNAEPSLRTVIAAPRVQGATYNLNVPAEDFNSPSYQARQEQELMAIRKRAANADQAEKDVASARRMLGMLKADRERQAMERAGVPPAEAMQKSLFQNMSYLVQPTDKNFESSMKAVRPPPPAPTVQNFSIPGSKDTVPAFVTQDANGVRRVQIVPGSALPKEDFKASVEEIAPGVKAAKLGPNHYQLLERPGVQGSLDAVTKTQIELWKSDRKALQSAMQNRTGEAKKAIQAQVDGLETKIMEAAKGGRVQAGQRRLKWNPETKDFE